MSIQKSIALLILLFTAVSCHVGRTIIWNFGDHDDYRKFDYQAISNSDTPFEFPVASHQLQELAASIDLPGEYLVDNSFEDFLAAQKTTSFFILQRDSLRYAAYFNGHQAGDLHCVNSVSKSFISLLVGMAIEEGKIGSLQDPISDYIYEFQGSELAALTIEDIIDMKSGIKFSEAYYNPFGNLSKFYYGTNMRKYVQQVELGEAPGRFNYISVNTDILGWVLERAIEQPVPQYLEEKVWRPLDMKYAATWSVDSEKHNVPKYSYGLNTRTSDLLKLGALYSNEGVFNGKRIVSKEWIDIISQVDTTATSAPHYKNHWWRDVEYKEELLVEEKERQLAEYEVEKADGTKQKMYKVYNGKYYAAGFLGQFIYVDPAQQLVIVRTGEKQGKADWTRLFRLLTERLDTD